jgi:hypothetical protein
MLSYILAIAVGLGSLSLYLATFFVPQIHRKDDFILSGLGLFYALVLWTCAGRITGGILLGELASVALLSWFVWETICLRGIINKHDEETVISEATKAKIKEISLITLLNKFTNVFSKKPLVTTAPTPKIQVETNQIEEILPNAENENIGETEEILEEEITENIAKVIVEDNSNFSKDQTETQTLLQNEVIENNQIEEIVEVTEEDIKIPSQEKKLVNIKDKKSFSFSKFITDIFAKKKPEVKPDEVLTLEETNDDEEISLEETNEEIITENNENTDDENITIELEETPPQEITEEVEEITPTETIENKEVEILEELSIVEKDQEEDQNLEIEETSQELTPLEVVNTQEISSPEKLEENETNQDNSPSINIEDNEQEIINAEIEEIITEEKAQEK